MALNNLTRIGNSGFGTDTSINTTGIVTAASFSGDGSGLTGITAVGSGVVVREEGSNVGTAQTINFIGTGVTATISGGIASIEIATSGGGGGGGLSDVVSDTTPQLGGNLDVNGKDITGTGGVNLTGVVTATTFVGALTGNASGNAATATTLQNARTIGGVSFDGSANINLPGVNAAGNQDTSGTASVATNVTVANEASDTECFVMFGVNATGNNAPKSSSSLKYNSSSGGLTAGSFIGDGSGLTGITASGSGVIVRDGGSLVGTAGTIDFGSNVSVSPISAGVVTVTASAGSIAGINTSGTTELNNLTVAGVSTIPNISGLTTFADTVEITGNLYLNGPSNQSDLYIGSSNQVKLDHNGSGALLSNTVGLTEIRAAGGVHLRKEGGGYDYIIKGTVGDAVELYHNNSKKFETTTNGVTITGTASATTFSGSGANLTNLDASDLASGTIPDARFPATLPAVSGANLTNLPAANITGTLPAISGANLTNLPSDTPADTDVQVTYDISAPSSSAYRFTGPGYSGADDNPDIYLVRGQRYRFINGTGSGHPFRIQSDTSGTAYTDGVSGSQSGTQDFNVQHDAPVRLYYQCTIHSGMIGNIYIVGGSDWRMTSVNTSTAPEIYTTRNVGIGTDNPLSRLHVSGTHNSHIRMTNTSDDAVDLIGDANRSDEGNTILAIKSRWNGTEVSKIVFQTDADTTNKDDGKILFHTKSSGSSISERLRITSGGEVQIANGNLKFSTAGTGIDFSSNANAAGMTSELLDDYEEGTWTPIFDTSISNGTLSGITYDQQQGKYRKIGSMVYIEGLLRTTAVTNGGNGTYDISGLPFTASADNTNGSFFCYSQHSWTNAPHQFGVVANTDHARARGGISVGDATYTNGYVDDFNTTSGSRNRVYFTGWYTTV